MMDVVASFARGVGRRSWLWTVVCVVVCAALASRIAADIVEGQALTDREVAPVVPHVAAPPPPAPVARPTGAALVDRDMFCSSCAPATAPVASGPMVAGDAVPMTTLPLILVATTLGREPIATIRDDHSGSQGAYGERDPLPGAGPVTHIGATYVDFENPVAQRIERVSLRGAAAVAVVDAKPAPGPEVAASPYADRVRKVDDSHYEVERGLIRDLVGAASKPMPGMRVMPFSKDGKLAGVKIVSARPDSVAGMLGLKSGDTLGAVNGMAIDSIDRMLEVYSKLDDLNRVTLDGTRGGKPMQLDYALR
jgi:hypothetical protein